MEIIHLKTDLAICSHTLRTRHRVSRALGITPRRGGLSPTCAPPPAFHFLYLFLRCQLSNQDCDGLCGSQLCFRRVSFRTAATILVLQSLKHSPWKRTATCCGLLWSPACVCADVANHLRRVITFHWHELGSCFPLSLLTYWIYLNCNTKGQIQFAQGTCRSPPLHQEQKEIPVTMLDVGEVPLAWRIYMYIYIVFVSEGPNTSDWKQVFGTNAPWNLREQFATPNLHARNVCTSLHFLSVQCLQHATDLQVVKVNETFQSSEEAASLTVPKFFGCRVWGAHATGKSLREMWSLLRM
jgi:hypothetical protein